MKLKYIIPSFVALMAMFVGCSDDNDPTYLDHVKVSSSYVGMPAEGGSQTITVSASADWQFDKVVAKEETTKDAEGKDVKVTNYYEAPDWLTVSVLKGAAGQTEVTFTAGPADASREVELSITSAGDTQRIKVIQMAEETDPVIITVAEAVDIIKGLGGSGNTTDAEYYVRGIVCRIQEISPQYGNATYFLSDDGKYSANGVWLEVYRGYWLNGAKFTAGDEFAVGDELVIKGILMDYQGTPETKQGACEVVSITKSLIGIEGVEFLGAGEDEELTAFPVEGGQAKVQVNSKGNGFHITIPAEAKSWLHIADFGGDYVTLEADANEGGDRTTTVVFSTESAGVTYSCEQTFSQKGAIIAATVAQFNAAEVGETLYRLTGVITNVANAGYGNYYLTDYSGTTYVYGTGAKGDFEAMGLKAGDVVTVVGKRAQYKETIEMTNSTVENTIPVTEVTVEEFLAKEDNPSVYYMVTGTVDEIANPTYGNLYLKDGDSRLYVYGCYPGWGASGDFRKNCLADNDIEVGDKLTVIGVKSTYKEVPQVNGGIYFSHEKAE